LSKTYGEVAEMKMYWSPENYFAADPTIVEHEGRFHLFFESTTAKAVEGEPRGPLSVCHYVSEDLVSWRELPVALRVGPRGEWDGYLLYHIDVMVTGGVWWMFYTGLDRAGNGQRQRVGVATSRDGVVWEKHARNPVLTNASYERAIPADGSHRAGNKDLGREWFRDPFVTFDQKRGLWVMAVVARDLAKGVDGRACVAGYSSTDLVNWKDEGPIFSPGRFHTVETPSIFPHENRHFLVYMSSPSWGVPIYSSDAGGQNAGNYVAVSESGVMGPYVALEDEILVGSAGALRMGAQRVLSVSDGRLMLYGWLATRPTADDAAVAGEEVRATVFPAMREVKVMGDHLRVEAPGQLLAARLDVVYVLDVGIGGLAMKKAGNGTHLQSYAGLGGGLFDAGSANVVLETWVTFGQGERAGLMFRCDREGRTGLAAVVDRRTKRVELVAFGALGGRAGAGKAEGESGLPIDSPTFVGGGLGSGAGAGFIDSRGWKVKDRVHLKVACQGVCVEVYVDGRLMIQQARHRERGAFAGVMVERAGAVFEGLACGKL
jgi:beta-fructofuranosidase